MSDSAGTWLLAGALGLAVAQAVLLASTLMDGASGAGIPPDFVLVWAAGAAARAGEAASFYDPAIASSGIDPTERHNVDKNMLAQDLTLVSTEVVIQARIAAAASLAYITAHWPEDVSGPHRELYRC